MDDESAAFLDSPLVRWVLPERTERREALGVPQRDTHLWPRWIFLRALGLVFLSAFVSLAGSIRGLIGDRGILPARDYLQQIAEAHQGIGKLWEAPTLLWISTSGAMLTMIVVAGFVASVMLTLNVAPRAAIVACGVLFLSFVAAAQDFSGYQSDGMLLQAAFGAFLVAPRGLRPKLGERDPPTPIALFLLRFEWFLIYFESGVAKLASGDPQWSSLTAMDHYYETGPLPTWIGWYVQHLPHGFHAATALFTLVVELVVVWFAWFPRPFKLATIALVTPLQLGIILTANYTFLNWLVLFLGVTFLDDRLAPRLRLRVKEAIAPVVPRWRTALATFAAAWIVWSCFALFAFGGRGALSWPARAISELRIANRYGLFASMTTGRWEIEFQATTDRDAPVDAPAESASWTAYPFRFKPQDPKRAPGIFAPYQPRFDWNLWFASLGPWDETPWILRVEELLLVREPTVMSLFAGDPLHGAAPAKVRAVLWEVRFTTTQEKRATGAWWKRTELGLYAPAMSLAADGRPVLDFGGS